MRELALALAIALCACRTPRTHVDDVLPDLDPLLGTAYTSAGGTDPLPATAEPTRWWQAFGDPVLDELVSSALAANLDLREAAASVREARERVRSSSGARGPNLDFAFAASRQRNILPGIASVTNTVYNPELAVSWQTDLFGRLAAAERSQHATWLATEDERMALIHTLIASVVRQRVQVSLLERRLQLARGIEVSRRNTLEVVRGRYGRGAGATAVDVYLAQENLSAARSSLPSLEGDLSIARHALDVLLGRKPGSTPNGDAPLSPLPNAPAPAPGLPVALLDARPDLRAARMRAEAGAAQVDVSLAALYPDLTLSTAAGWTSTVLEDLFTSSTFGGNVAARLAAPLFASGRLRSDVRVARARLDGLAAAYAARVLDALREVEDGLVREQRLREQLDAAGQQRDEVQRADDLARDRYGRGLESLLTVLDTERRRAVVEDQVLQLEAAVWNARVDLILALGGNWLESGAESAPDRATEETPEP